MSMNMNRNPIPSELGRYLLGWPCLCPKERVGSSKYFSPIGWAYCPWHGDPEKVRGAERHANLLAGLNDAPAALIGWDVEERSHVRLRTGELIPVSRYRRLDAMWWELKGGAYAERVRTDQATRYHALTGRTLPDSHLRVKSPMTALDAMENLQEALREAARPVVVMLEAIAEACSKIAFPRLKFSGDLSQDDVVKGA